MFGGALSPIGTVSLVRAEEGDKRLLLVAVHSAVDQMVVLRAQVQPDRYAINIDVQEQPPVEQMKTVQRWRQALRSKPSALKATPTNEAEQEWELRLSSGFEHVTKGCLLRELEGSQWWRCVEFETPTSIIVDGVAEKDLPWNKSGTLLVRQLEVIAAALKSHTLRYG